MLFENHVFIYICLINSISVILNFTGQDRHDPMVMKIHKLKIYVLKLGVCSHDMKEKNCKMLNIYWLQNLLTEKITGRKRWIKRD